MARHCMRQLLAIALVVAALATLGVSPVHAAPPPNDDFDTATVIGSLPFTDELDTSEATRAPDDPADCIEFGHTVWYQFTPTTDLVVLATTAGSGYDTALSVYTGERDNLTPLDLCYVGSEPSQRVHAMAGETYFFMVGAVGEGDGGHLVFTVKELFPPPNDDFDTATVIESLPFRDELDTTDASTAPDDPDCIWGGPTVWYQFTPSSDLIVTASTAGSDSFTTLSVYTGERGNLTRLACDGGISGSPSSSVEVSAVAGETYFFMVGSSSHLVFTVEEGPPPPPSPPNDGFDQATVIGSLPFTDELDTTNATPATDDPDCGEGHTVWYQFTATQNLTLIAETVGSDYNPNRSVSVYTGERGNLTQLVCEVRSLTRISISAIAGETYHFMLGAGGAGNAGHFVFTVREPAPPSNDDFDTATVIASLPFRDELDVTDATRATDDPECAGTSATVWYQFTASRDLPITANTFGSDNDTTLSVYTGERGSLTQLDCNVNSPVQFSAVAGETYFFMVGMDPNYWSLGGHLVFTVREAQLPPNDDFDRATVIDSLSFRDEVNATDATRAADDPVCFGEGGTVWYQFTPSQDLVLTASTVGSDYDTTLAVYTGQRGSLSRLDCNDDIDFGPQEGPTPVPQSRIHFDAVAGETYYFMIGSHVGSGSGQLVFTLKEAIPLVIELKIASEGTITPTSGAVKLHGTLTCSRAARASVELQVAQRRGESIIRGAAGTEVACNGRTRWQLTVPADTGRFVAGNADVTGVASGCDTRFMRPLCATDDTTTTVRLRRWQP